ncbi:peptide-N(4)-(N-acetyl-beta-glucosaminyl)asparagine amidase [Chelonus insularis]|uniref:peptide-N(4)-(N-acetyl-beta- glucosaminyl)asparagine amidase n=1 Tax=Chelonus insularis TaxID=460826 RepID=UPI00158D86EC|nr:peptide-N(4)-(N-acetyl-beta-glucosaminyl)asparagine amidase [Chelonus insularis]
MENTFNDCVNMLKENTSHIFQTAIQTLYKICDNIVKFPSDEKYRKLRIANPVISEKLLPAIGATEFLFELGFVEDDEFFLLPSNFSRIKLENALKLLKDLKNLETLPKKNNAIKSLHFTNKNPQRNSFFKTIQSHFESVLNYENSELQKKANSCIPIDKLKLNAVKQLRVIQKEIILNSNNGKNSTEESQVSIEELLLREVMHWFKNEFFTWMDSPKCKSCTQVCTFNRNEFRNDPRISRVEIHMCKQCNTEEEFPRYTDSEILLKTRTGRCGEWANTFTLICRSLGYEARIVYDQTDHVWTEVWLINSHRWVHVDPCEDTYDRPLLYEKGWNKKLSYIIAFSKDEIQDVTWRYTRNQANVMKRRKICSEEHLLDLIINLNEERLKFLTQQGCSEARNRFIIKRRLMELVEFLPAPPGMVKPDQQNDTNEYGGRISGSTAWRAARNEISEIRHDHVWEVPKDTKTFHLQYFVVENKYYTLNDNNEVLTVKQSWEAGVNSCVGGIFRKEEKDWKMVYLARSPGSQIGKITWSVAIKNQKVNIETLEFSADTTVFEDGCIKWTIQGINNNKIVSLNVPSDKYFKTDQLKNVERINVIAEMSGGSKDISWQHAQLFRKSLDATKECSMKICLTLNNKH